MILPSSLLCHPVSGLACCFYSLSFQQPCFKEPERPGLRSSRGPVPPLPPHSCPHGFCLVWGLQKYKPHLGAVSHIVLTTAHVPSVSVISSCQSVGLCQIQDDTRSTDFSVCKESLFLARVFRPGMLAGPQHFTHRRIWLSTGGLRLISSSRSSFSSCLLTPTQSLILAAHDFILRLDA